MVSFSFFIANRGIPFCLLDLPATVVIAEGTSSERHDILYRCCCKLVQDLSQLTNPTSYAPLQRAFFDILCDIRQNKHNFKNNIYLLEFCVNGEISLSHGSEINLRNLEIGQKDSEICFDGLNARANLNKIERAELSYLFPIIYEQPQALSSPGDGSIYRLLVEGPAYRIFPLISLQCLNRYDDILFKSSRYPLYLGKDYEQIAHYYPQFNIDILRHQQSKFEHIAPLTPEGFTIL